MKKIFVLPTDTVYGIFTRIYNTNEKKKIFQLKKRNKDKPLSIYVNSIKQIEKFCDQAKWNDIKVILDSFLPGPFTFILPVNIKIPFITKRYKIGFRYTENNLLNSFISKHGIIAGTSFNISKEPDIYIIESEENLPINSDEIEIVKGECEHKESSTIIEWINNKELLIHRKTDKSVQILKSKLKNFVILDNRILIQ